MENPNENCLKDMQCPDCGSYGPFKIYASSWFLMEDDGSDDFEDIIYNDHSNMCCVACNHEATAAEFQGKRKLAEPSILVLIDETGEVVSVLADGMEEMPRVLVVREQMDEPTDEELGRFNLNGKTVTMGLMHAYEGQNHPAVFKQAFEMLERNVDQKKE